VAERDSDRVGRVGAEFALQLEQCLDHQLNLFLLRPARADDRQLHLARRVLVDLRVAREHGAQRGTAGLAELECAVGIAVHEHPLDRDLPRGVLAHQRGHSLKDLAQPGWKLRAARPDGAARDVASIAFHPVDDAEASRLRAGIEPKDAHGAAARRRRARR